MQDMARLYATEKHKNVNHLYDGKPYEYHLLNVVIEVQCFYLSHYKKYNSKIIDIVISSAWCHDVIEDTRETYNDLVSAVNLDVANIVYALTNEKGKCRKERANDKYYEGIVNTPHATYIKICDRIANVRYSKVNNNYMFLKYKQENDNFRNKLNLSGFNYMWSELDLLFSN